MEGPGGWLGVAVGLAVLVVLGIARGFARRHHKDSLSGVLTLTLASIAVVFPVVGALAKPEHLTTWAWVCLAAIVVATWATTTEWRISSLRVWIGAVALASTPLLVVIGTATSEDRLEETGGRLAADHVAVRAADENRIEHVWDSLTRDQVELVAVPVTIPELPDPADQSDTAKLARQSHTAAQAAEQARSNLASALAGPAPKADTISAVERAARTASRTADTRVAALGNTVLGKVPILRATPDGAVVAAERAATQAEKDGGAPYRLALERLSAAITAYRDAVVGGAGDPGTWPVPELAEVTDDPGWREQVLKGGETVIEPVVAWADVEPDPWLWGIVALLALLGWWFAERRTNSRIAGPVTVTVTAAETETESKPSPEATLFRNAIRKNVSQPGTYPGAGAQPLTDLQTVVGVVEKGAVAAAINLLKAIFSWPRGSLVDVHVVAAPAAKSSTAEATTDGGSSASGSRSAGLGTSAARAVAGRYRVLVTVRDAATKKQIDIKEFRHSELRDACNEAGHWASAVVIASSPRFPRWATWSPRSAAAFASVDTIGDEPSVEDLQAALALAPDSGLLVHRLGDAFELVDRPVAALECYARAVQVDATQYRSTYRLAAVVASLARDLENDETNSAWLAAEPALRDAAVAALNRALVTLEMNGLVLGSERSPQERLRCIAYELFGWVADQQKRRKLLWRWASRAHRDSLGPLRALTSWRGPAETLKWMASSGQRAVSARPHGESATDQRRDDPRALAPMLYNLACCAALHGRPEVAIDLLERALTAPLAEQVTGPWLRKDPDLVSLHSLPRFQRLAPAAQEED